MFYNNYIDNEIYFNNLVIIYNQNGHKNTTIDNDNPDIRNDIPIITAIYFVINVFFLSLSRSVNSIRDILPGSGKIATTNAIILRIKRIGGRLIIEDKSRLLSIILFIPRNCRSAKYVANNPETRVIAV